MTRRWDVKRGDRFMVFDKESGELIRGVIWADEERNEFAQYYVHDVCGHPQRRQSRLATRVVRRPITVREFAGPKNRVEWLVEQIRKHNLTNGVEVGVARGHTTFSLLRQCPRLRMIAVDYWPDEFARMRQEWLTHASRFKNRLVLIELPSVDAAKRVSDKSQDFVFIDADHSEDACYADIVAWRPKIRKGGLLCGHDYNWSGVSAAVRRALKDYQVFWPDSVWYTEIDD